MLHDTGVTGLALEPCIQELLLILIPPVVSSSIMQVNVYCTVSDSFTAIVRCEVT